MRIKWLLLFSPFIITSSIAQKTTLLKDVLHYCGISVPAPILKTPLSEPAEFKVLQVGTDSVFRGGKPLTGSELSLFKFYLCPTDFLPLKMEIESPNTLEVYVDGEKNADKYSTEKSWDKAGSVTVNLKADPRQYVIVVKMQVNATDSYSAMLKVSVLTEKRDSSAVFTFSSSERRRYWTSDFLMGKKTQGVSLSPNGRFALINYIYVYKDGSVGNCCELTALEK